MARGLVKQQCIDEDEWPLAQRVFAGAVKQMMTATGGNHLGMCFRNDLPNNQDSMANTFGAFGLYASQVAKGLQNEGLKANAIDAKIININNLGPRKAVIGLFLWRPAPNGGHFICAARQARNGRIVYLDPGEGSLSEQWNNGTYIARNGAIADLVTVVNVWA
ncbi:hypothetical protein [Sphingomonas bacterium]|uniref:hypothetical protein n=1 Tax=Sphingomonas bacterium TaxID=1895847 RepID=UPI0015772A1F|nr:hypothetical protein [Sphingomonas bacterium]